MRCTILANTVTVALLALSATVAAEQQTTQEFLDEANRLLLSGDFREAIKHYDTAIERDPQNYLTYFNRATTLLSINRHASAARDFSRVIELKPDFEQAYYHRARVYLKEGNYIGASDDLEMISSGNTDLLTKSSGLRDKVVLAKQLSEKAAKALDDKKYDECVSAATRVIQASPLFIDALRVRAACRVAEGDLEGASADLGRLVRIRPGDLETLNMLADLHFLALNEPDRGMDSVRACLKSDPDNKLCKATYSRLRSLQRKVAKVESDKEKRKWNACNRAVAPLSGKDGLLADVDAMYAEFIVTADIPASVPSKLATRLAGFACEGFTNTKKWDNALTYCERVLAADPDNVDALGNQFDAQLERGKLEQAQGTLAKLESIASSGGGVNQQKMHERRMKLENQKRLASRKDYYKILGVEKDASSAEIKKAFRKLAHQWHPDRYRGDLPKDEVEEKMADINLAYEVLMDEEKRASFDQGHDPNDPTGGAGPGGPGGGFGGFGGHPFVFRQGGGGGQGGRPMFFQQGGGGQQFSFQFGGGGGGFPF